MKILRFSSYASFDKSKIDKAGLIVKKSIKSSPIIVFDMPKKAKKLLKNIDKKKLNQQINLTKNFTYLKKEILTIKEDICFAGNDQEIEKTLDKLKSIAQNFEKKGKISTEFSCDFLSFGFMLYAHIFVKTLTKLGINAVVAPFLRMKNTPEFDLSQEGDKLDTAENTTLVFPGGTYLRDSGETGQIEGGGDYMATVLSNLLKSDDVEFWGEFEGVKTSDPLIVRDTTTIKQMNYQEAMELAHFGSKIISDNCLKRAKLQNISLHVRSLNDPLKKGTCITSKIKEDDKAIVGISSIRDIVLFRVQGSGMAGRVGTAQRLFGALAKESISLILISQASSEQSICFAIKSDKKIINKATKSIKDEFRYEFEQGIIENIEITKNLATISVIGENMRHCIGLSGKLFGSLGRNGINVYAIAQGSSEINISVVISKKDIRKALNSVHSEFFSQKKINIFIVGLGLIGSTLLQQISQQKEFLNKKYGFQFTLRGVADVDKMYFGDGLGFDNWKQKLQSGEKTSLEKFVSYISDENFSNAIFVDCTALGQMTKIYLDLLSSSVSVVTPNKKANSSEIDIYEKLHKTAVLNNAKFYYETNVGAGLPIISTLKDLLRSGDKIERIQAVLSGTLSYIFNNFNSKNLFSEIVKKAQLSGFTEPNPKDDLTGEDVARKTLILSREMGKRLNMSDIKRGDIIPQECLEAESSAEFFKKLKKNENYFIQKVSRAEKNNCRLRFLATITETTSEIALQEVGKDSPFYNLRGSDNMVVFTTKRYTKNMPLVIKGPGAGAQVTAGGVFADIIKIANYFIY